MKNLACRTVRLSRLAPCLLAALLAAVGTFSARAASLSPVEIRVNQSFAGDQRYPAVAAAADGSFVVVWESEVGGRSVTDILARRFSADGSPRGDEFVVNTTTANRQVFPAVAMNDNGEFVVAWDSLGQDGPGVNVYAQRFNGNGTRRGSEMRVNNGTHDPAARVGVAIDPAGDFVIVWPERNTPLVVAATVRIATINARTFTADGTPLGDQFDVASSVPTNYRIPAIGMAANGNFVVAWQSDATQVLPIEGIGSTGAGIYVRRFSLAGKALGAATQVDVASSNKLLNLRLPIGNAPMMSDRPAIAVGNAGDFVVAWQNTLEDYSPAGVFARAYDSAGAALGAYFQVGGTQASLSAPSISMDRNGRATVVAQGNGIIAQRFTEQGIGAAAQAQLAPPARIDNGQPGLVLFPSVAADASGRVIAVWQDFGVDGDGRGVVARLYAP